MKARALGILFFSLAAGCAGAGEAPPGATAQMAPLAVDASLVGPRENALPGKAATAPPPVEQPRKKGGAPPVAARTEPPLNVAGLTARLRDTKAIGVLTKLALRNQLDDLLKQFRAQHESGQTIGIAALRQPYDMLVLKVLSAVQDGDPSLARTIAGSREAIWNLLADADKFNSVTDHSPN